VQRADAQADPVGFVADLPHRTVLDEVQRVPELFTSLKAAVDSRRKSGRFILTGSANVLLVPKLADSLAGRMEIMRLHPSRFLLGLRPPSSKIGCNTRPEKGDGRSHKKKPFQGRTPVQYASLSYRN
jgi:hypothetical protein